MGSVLTPMLDGLAQSQDLPRACTLNGQCQEVCPLPFRCPRCCAAGATASGGTGWSPPRCAWELGLWRFLVLRPALYRLASGVAIRMMPAFARGGWIARMPMAGGWTRHRDLPRPPSRTFIAQYRSRKPLP